MSTGSFWTLDKLYKDDCHERLRDAGHKARLGNGYTAMRHDEDAEMTETKRNESGSEIAGKHMIRLKSVTKENLDDILALRVHGEQEGYVSSNAESLAQAYVYSGTAWPFGVYEDETLVGFIMMGYYEAKHYYTLWKFMIDRRFQNKGYGRQALRLGLAFLKEKFGPEEVYTGVAPGNSVAKKLYESAGFVDTGFREFGMEEMCLKLKDL